MKQKGIIITTLLFLSFLFFIAICNREYDEEEITSNDLELPSDKSNPSKSKEIEKSLITDIIDENDTIKEKIVPSNDFVIPNWNKDEIDKANTAKNSDYLSSIEKQIILYTNLVRLNGKKFSDLYIKSRYNSQPNNSYIKSLIEDLSRIKDLPMLTPNESLFKAAEFHANDLGRSGTFQHESTDGSSPSQRMKRYGFNYCICAENIYAGQEDALGVLIVLLIDEGLADVGHRKNILCADFDEIGVSRRPHKIYNYNVVQDFGHR